MANQATENCVYIQAHLHNMLTVKSSILCGLLLVLTAAEARENDDHVIYGNIAFTNTHI